MTREEFEALPYLPRKDFSSSAKERFSRLDKDYVVKKYNEERFPVEGNAALAKAVGRTIEARRSGWEKKDGITLLDIGAAGGALTTLFMLAELGRLGLLAKIRLTLVDISRQALESTVSGDFGLPPSLFADFGYCFQPEHARGLLRNAAIEVRSAISLGDLPPADIVLSAFTHHHMNLADKQRSSREMERIARPEGIIGVADECLSYEDYIEWLETHHDELNGRGEQVPIAVESFIPLAEHKGFFRHVRMAEEAETRYFYYFCGTKRAVHPRTSAF
jgi:SAM-dependent methyltransferase